MIQKYDNDTILFDNKEFKNFSRLNNYKINNNFEKIIYKCINYRKEKNSINQLNLKIFCITTIIYILPGQKKKENIILKTRYFISYKITLSY